MKECIKIIVVEKTNFEEFFDEKVKKNIKTLDLEYKYEKNFGIE